MEESFWQHIAELRRCLIRAALALLLGFSLSLVLSKDLLHLLTLPAGKLVFLRPAEALMAQLKVAFINGILVSLPVVLWQIGRFLWPALYPHERKALLLYLPFTFILFGTGMVFGYWVVVRLGYRFLLSLAPNNITPVISLDYYLSFVLSSVLACAVIFTLPIAVLLLAKIGLLKASFLWRQQRSIIIGLMILVAVITPTVDIISMLLVFLPLLFLFEISVLLAWLAECQRKRKEKRFNRGIPSP